MSPHWPRTRRDLALWLHVASVLLAVRVLVRLVRFRTLMRWLTPPPHTRRIFPMEQVALYLDALLPRVPPSKRGRSLPRGLVLYRFAARTGLPVRLRCAVSFSGRGLDGHAWLTLDGTPYLSDAHDGWAEPLTPADAAGDSGEG